MLCPLTNHNCQILICNAKHECAMQRGVGYSQVQQSPAQEPFCKEVVERNCEIDVERAQADSLEAHSLKYHHCAQVFQLSSGRFALFGSFANGEGIPLIAIGSWEELEPHVREYRQQADAHAERPKPMKVDIAAKPSTAYDDLFGDS